ncbi:MAG: ABC transporter ATP-binding protein [bacterium]|nr:ABC transporter ATP-binding protein [bacterium]
MYELQIDRLTKQYKNKIAVDSLSYQFTNGVYGLLGANGAGKTTLMRMICDILRPTKGEILFNHTDIHTLGGEYRRILGYLPQTFGFYPDFTAYRYMMYLASLKALPAETAKDKVDELLQLVGLTSDKDKKVKTYSGGMLRRLGIAQALLNDPQILILDEPTSGLDPKERIRFRNIISSLGKDRIIILSTHIVSDVEYIANQIILMKNGQIIKTGKPEDIVQLGKGHVFDVHATADEVEAMNQRYAISNLKNVDDGINLRIVSDEKPLGNAIEVEPTLEDVYLYYFSEEVDRNEHISL